MIAAEREVSEAASVACNLSTQAYPAGFRLLVTSVSQRRIYFAQVSPRIVDVAATPAMRRLVITPVFA